MNFWMEDALGVVWIMASRRVTAHVSTGSCMAMHGLKMGKKEDLGPCLMSGQILEWLVLILTVDGLLWDHSGGSHWWQKGAWNGHGLWFGEVMVAAASLQRGSADMDVGHNCATLVQSEADLGQVQLTMLNTLTLQDK